MEEDGVISLVPSIFFQTHWTWELISDSESSSFSAAMQLRKRSYSHGKFSQHKWLRLDPLKTSTPIYILVYTCDTYIYVYIYNIYIYLYLL